MRRIFVGIIGAALLGLAVTACTGSHASPTAASAITTASSGVGTVTTMAACAGPNQCQFEGVGGTFSGTYTGTTTATSAPNNGHHGSLTLTFNQPYGTSVTFKWSGFQTGSQAVCTITGPGGFNQIVDCHDNTPNGVTFNNLQSGTYTFTDKKNPEQSADDWQVKPISVTVNSSANVTATWKSIGGFTSTDDDPNTTYRGTLTGPLGDNNFDGTLYADADSTPPTKCGLGGGLPAATHFHVIVSSQSASSITGSYKAQDCTIDQGTFSVSK